MAILLLIGNISGKIGRRPVLLFALGCALAGSVVFFVADCIAELLIGRLFHGIAVGILGAASAAALVDLEPRCDRSRAALFATVANMAGLVGGSLLAGNSRNMRRCRCACPGWWRSRSDRSDGPLRLELGRRDGSSESVFLLAMQNC